MRAFTDSTLFSVDKLWERSRLDTVFRDIKQIQTRDADGAGSVPFRGQGDPGLCTLSCSWTVSLAATQQKGSLFSMLASTPSKINVAATRRVICSLWYGSTHPPGDLKQPQVACDQLCSVPDVEHAMRALRLKFMEIRSTHRLCRAVAEEAWAAACHRPSGPAACHASANRCAQKQFADYGSQEDAAGCRPCGGAVLSRQQWHTA